MIDSLDSSIVEYWTDWFDSHLKAIAEAPSNLRLHKRHWQPPCGHYCKRRRGLRINSSVEEWEAVATYENKHFSLPSPLHLGKRTLGEVTQNLKVLPFLVPIYPAELAAKYRQILPSMWLWVCDELQRLFRTISPWRIDLEPKKVFSADSSLLARLRRDRIHSLSMGKLSDNPCNWNFCAMSVFQPFLAWMCQSGWTFCRRQNHL